MFRSAWALIVNTAITGILGLAYWAVSARLFPAADVGRGSTVISAMLLVSGIAQLNLPHVLPRFLPTAGTRTRELLLRSYLLAAGVGVVAALVFLVVAPRLGWGDDFVGVNWWTAASFVAAVVVWTAFTTQDSILVGLHQALLVPVENLVFAIVKVALLVALAGMPLGLGIWVSWTITAALAIVPVTWFIFARAVPRHVEAHPTCALPTRPDLWRFLGKDYAGSMCHLAMTSLVPLVVASRLGFTEAGHFFVVWVVVGMIDLVVVNVGISLTVEGAGRPEELASLVRSVARFLAVIVGPLALIGVFAAEPILGLLGAGYAADGTVLLRLIAVAFVPRAIVLLYFAVCRLTHHMTAVVIGQAVVGLVTVGASWFLVEPFGISGVGLAYLAGQLLVGLWALRPLLAIARGEGPTVMVRLAPSSPLDSSIDGPVTGPVRNAVDEVVA